MVVKKYELTKTDGTTMLLQVVQQPDGSFPTPEECLAKWPRDERAKVASWREIEDSAVR